MQEQDTPEHHRQRSEFVRHSVQQASEPELVGNRYRKGVPRRIVQYWHDLKQLPHDIEECVESWTRWGQSRFAHTVFDEHAARTFILRSLGRRHEEAFGRCYHPAMQADYFRLCFLFVEGGFYVDADDVCIGDDIDWLFKDGRLKLQPLCYDVSSGTMVNSSVFLDRKAYDPSWIFYFNNNPLIAGRGHPIIERALIRATSNLEQAADDELPEIQETTGPGNLTKTIFEFGSPSRGNSGNDLVILRDWDSIAHSRWPLSHRSDSRNWRLSNQKKFAK